MADPSLVPFIVNAIPLIIQGADVIFYVVSITIFGGIAVRGFSRRPNGLVRYAAMVFTGLLSVAAGKAFSRFIPVPNEGIFQLLSLDSFAAALAASLAFFFSFRLLSAGLQMEPLKRLESEFSALRKRLIEERILKPISEKTAREMAAHAAGGDAKAAKLEGDSWIVSVEKGKNIVSVSVNAADGAINEIIYSKSKAVNFFHNPYRLLGLAVLIATALVVAAFFSGFPSISKQLEGMGFSQELLDKLSEQPQQSSGCADAFSLLNKPVNIATLPVYTDSSLKGQLEQEAGTEITDLRVLSKGPPVVIMGLTDDGRACIYTAGEVCGCVAVRGGS